MNEKFLNSDDGILESALGLKKRDYHKMQVIEVYFVDGQIMGIEHDEVVPSITIRGFEFTHDLRGKSAHIVIVSHDSRVSRNVAIEFAGAIATGRYVRRNINLSEVQGRWNSAKSRQKGSK